MGNLAYDLKKVTDIAVAYKKHRYYPTWGQCISAALRNCSNHGGVLNMKLVQSELDSRFEQSQRAAKRKQFDQRE